MKRVIIISRHGRMLKMTLDTDTDVCLAETPVARSDGKRNASGTDHFLHRTRSGELHHYRYEWSNRAEGQDRIRLISRERARYEMAYLPKGSTVTKDGMRYLVFGSRF